MCGARAGHRPVRRGREAPGHRSCRNGPDRAPLSERYPHLPGRGCRGWPRAVDRSRDRRAWPSSYRRAEHHIGHVASATLAQTMDIAAVRLDPGLPLPAHARPGDAGLDLYARESASIDPGERRLMPTGLAVAIPPGHAGLVLPRSGLVVQAVAHVQLVEIDRLPDSERGTGGFGSTGS